MKVSIGCDHGAYEFKEKAVKHLEEKGYEVIDFGTNSPDSVDYPDFAAPAAAAVVDGQADLGIVMCGTGIGASIAANKVKGVRCALVSDAETAKVTREHNDSNVLALGARNTDEDVLFAIIDNWLSEPFSNDERHIRRINKISELEG